MRMDSWNRSGESLEIEVPAHEGGKVASSMVARKPNPTGRSDLFLEGLALSSREPRQRGSSHKTCPVLERREISVDETWATTPVCLPMAATRARGRSGDIARLLADKRAKELKAASGTNLGPRA
ncbi:hypothetical protein KM043_001860 [Ampulex compressa]|nr:hypothetical protein KM043_001860 [Ampulex compressa]